MILASACGADRFTAQPNEATERETSKAEPSGAPGMETQSVPTEVGSVAEPTSATSGVDAATSVPTTIAPVFTSGMDGGVDVEAGASTFPTSPTSSSPVSAPSSSTLVGVTSADSSETAADAGSTSMGSSTAPDAEATTGSDGNTYSSHGDRSDGGLSNEQQHDASVVDAGAPDAGPPFVDVEPPPDPDACNSGEFGAPQVVLGLGYSDRLWGPAISADGMTLFFGYTGGDEDIYRATLRADRGRTFSNVTALSNINRSSNEGTPFLSYDGHTLYFYSDREGGAGGRDLWQATRDSQQGSFTDVKTVQGLNAASYDHLPWLSDTELTIYYTTERDGGLGRSDIWVATRNSKSEPFSAPRLVAGINSGAREDAVAFSPDRLTLYFTTDRDAEGNLDIWRAVRPSLDAEFQSPEVMPTLNSEVEDTNLAMTRDGKRLYFSSGRDGGQRIWVATRTCP